MDIDNNFFKDYEIIMDRPSPCNSDEYYQKAEMEYLSLLSKDLPESSYQDFFERNPSFMPGAFEVIGHSSFLPFNNALISQPIISNETKSRKPDFMWIARNSISLCPVLIEIEKPSKLGFRKNSDITRADFNQALNQLKQWRAILSNPEGVLKFYQRFQIPEEWQKLKFSPQFVLIYGRRNDFASDDWLTSTREEYQEANIRIMSFDRLCKPDKNVIDCITCKVKNNQYHVQYISPTFVFRPNTVNAIGGYGNLYGFLEAIDKMEYTSTERKEFLKKRLSYWNDYGQKLSTGLILSSDKE